jgi:predicted transposase YdaD
MLMQSQKLYEEYTRKVRAEGRKEGREEGLERGLRDGIVAVCAARGLTLRAGHRAKLTAEADPAVLRRWLARAATATRAAEVFAEDAG